MESIDQMHVSHSKMATVVDYDMSANEFLAGLPPQVCPPALLFRLGSRKVRRYKNTWIRNSSDAMAQQQWKVVRRRRSSEGCSTFPQKCHFTPMLSRHVCLTHGKSGHPGPGHPHQEGGHHQWRGHASRFTALFVHDSFSILPKTLLHCILHTYTLSLPKQKKLCLVYIFWNCMVIFLAC